MTGLRTLLDQCPCKVPNFPNIELGVDFDMETRGHGGISKDSGNEAQTYYDDVLNSDIVPELRRMKGVFPMGYIPVIFTGSQIEGSEDGGGALGATLGDYGIIMYFQAAQFVLGHELGHYAGYDYKGNSHHPDSTNLMFRKVGGAFVDDIWCNAVAELANRQGF